MMLKMINSFFTAPQALKQCREELAAARLEKEQLASQKEELAQKIGDLAARLEQEQAEVRRLCDLLNRSQEQGRCADQNGTIPGYILRHLRALEDKLQQREETILRQKDRIYTLEDALCTVRESVLGQSPYRSLYDDSESSDFCDYSAL